LLQTLQESTATTDNKANAQAYDEDIDAVFTAAALKNTSSPPQPAISA